MSAPSLPPGVVLGTAYLVSGNIFSWDGTSYTGVGTLSGPAGPTGPTGPQGPAAVGQTATIYSIQGSQTLAPTTAYSVYRVNGTGNVLTLPAPSTANTGWQIEITATTLSGGNAFGLTGNINTYNYTSLGFIRGCSVSLTSDGSTWVMAAQTEGLRSQTLVSGSTNPATPSSGATYIGNASPPATGTQPPTSAVAGVTLGSASAIQATGTEVSLSSYQCLTGLAAPASIVGLSGIGNSGITLGPGQFSEVFSDGSSWRERTTNRLQSYMPSWSMANKNATGSKGWSYTVSARTSQDMFFPWDSSDSYGADTRAGDDPCFTQSAITASNITSTGVWTSPMGIYPTVGGYYRFQITPTFLFSGSTPQSFTLGLSIWSGTYQLMQHATNGNVMLYIPVTPVAIATYSQVPIPTYTIIISTSENTITAPLYFQASVYFPSAMTTSYTYYHTVMVDKIG